MNSVTVLSAVFVIALAVSHAAVADVIAIDAGKDTTLYSKDDKLSNGAGEFFFAGRTDGGDLLRGVIALDIAAAVPTGATITDVTLELYMSRTRGGTEAVSLHRVTADWGEGISDADGEEGGGANAESGDATWRYRLYDVDTPESSPAWSTLGGDFDGASSASILVGNNGFYTWGSTVFMVADVQGWLDDPSSNFGWVLVGNEASNRTAKRFNTRQNSNTSRRPLLTVTFTPASGACCFDDGSCSVLDSGTCTTQGGSYSGNGTTCTPNDCPQPGACCLSDGTCSDVLATACATAGGTFQGTGTTCATTDCDGACCFTNGSCLETTLTDCGNQGGTYQSFGSVCTPNPCAQPDGACCFGDGSCQVLTQSGCSGQGGSYQGDGTNCSPNLCPQPGACCQNDGTCSVVFEPACTTSGSSYEGDGTTCMPNPCPQPGACCFDDGSCTEGFQADCDTALGQFQGGARHARPMTARNREPAALMTAPVRCCSKRTAWV